VKNEEEQEEVKQFFATTRPRRSIRFTARLAAAATGLGLSEEFLNHS